MKKLILYLISFLLLLGCELNDINHQSEETKQQVQDQDKIDLVSNGTWEELPLKVQRNQAFVHANAFALKINSPAHFDLQNKTLSFAMNGQQYYLIEGVPVVQLNGIFLPGKSEQFTIIDEQPWISLKFMTDSLALKAIQRDEVAEVYIPETMISAVTKEKPASATLESVEQVIELMSDLTSPITGAEVDTIPSHLPGANRAYRNGVHEGLDWYGYSTGVPMNRQTEVFAMAEGIVVRSDHQYQRYQSVEERNNDLQIAAEAGLTPVYILDRLRGRQVWVQYRNGLQARFAHLDSIPANVQVGDVVTAETLIGFVGNSGTSGDVKNDDSEFHLHLDLLYRGELFWKGLTTEEIETVLKTVFANEKGQSKKD